MLKISVVLVTTAAFAALLIAYPFSPRPAAQASGGVEQVAATEPAREARPTTLHAPVGIAALPQAAALSTGEIGKALPLRTPSVGSDPAAGRGETPTTVARTDPARTADPRIPPRPSQVERQGIHSTTAPVLGARPAPARSEFPAGPVGSRYPAYTGRTAVSVPPSGTLARHASGARTSARQTHRAHRYRSLALAPDQPTS
jgi:hypothetical protein